MVSHDRYFMDKLVDHVFVFEGNGKIKDYYGNYTEYYRIKLAEEARAASKKNVQAPVNKAKEKDDSNKVRKPTYKEKKEYEELEQEVQFLEQQKEAIMERMNSGSCSNEELAILAKDYAVMEQLINTKTDRWLELSELFMNLT